MDWKTWKSNYFRRRPRINKNRQMFFNTCHFENAQRIFIAFYLKVQMKHYLQLHLEKKQLNVKIKAFGDGTQLLCKMQ